MKNVSAGKKFLCRTPIPEEKTVISSVTFRFALGDDNRRDNRLVSDYREKLERCLTFHENWVGERADE